MPDSAYLPGAGRTAESRDAADAESDSAMIAIVRFGHRHVCESFLDL